MITSSWPNSFASHWCTSFIPQRNLVCALWWMLYSPNNSQQLKQENRIAYVLNKSFKVMTFISLLYLWIFLWFCFSIWFFKKIYYADTVIFKWCVCYFLWLQCNAINSDFSKSVKIAALSPCRLSSGVSLERTVCPNNDRQEMGWFKWLKKTIFVIPFCVFPMMKKLYIYFAMQIDENKWGRELFKAASQLAHWYKTIKWCFTVWNILFLCFWVSYAHQVAFIWS